MSRYIEDALNEFWSSHISKVGVFFLVFIIAVSLYTVATFPLDYGLRYWNNPKYWVDNPKAAMPSWINLLYGGKYLEHSILSTELPSKAYPSGGYYLKFYNKFYDLNRDQFPVFLTLKIEEIVYYRSPPSLVFIINRPDNKSVELSTMTVEKPLANEKSPFIRYHDEPRRALISGDTNVAYSLSEFLKKNYDVSLTPSQIMDIGYEKIIFGKIDEKGNFKPLKGRYELILILKARDPKDNIGRVTFIIGGQVYGAMGTDTLGRDLSQGLLFGFPVALLIGFVTSILTTVIGASLGVIGGYVGGRVDDLIQRASDVVNNLPQLPLLIFLTFIFGGKLWVIVTFLIAFGWPGLVIVVRSMILQIKSSSFVEAAKAIGASKWRIMGRHIFPQVAPYILSQMIFYTPSAILSEAALSFLGLGDPSLPTWGQILEYGFNNSAVYLGYWWWILPPGLLIVFSAITFVLMALGLEPVVNPRLRRWR